MKGEGFFINNDKGKVRKQSNNLNLPMNQIFSFSNGLAVSDAPNGVHSLPS